MRPKPLIDIHGKPLLWHIMKHYSDHGFTDFIVCTGYKGYQIKDYFSKFYLHNSDFTVNLNDGELKIHNTANTPWNVTVVDTGLNTMTGGRLKRVGHLLGETFMLTYGDGVSDIDLKSLLDFHRTHGNPATITAVRPPSRFAVLDIESSGRVASFREKPDDEVGWINGGFFVLNRDVLDLIDSDSTSWERKPLETLAKLGQLQAFRHEGFWHAVDSLRDKRFLENKFSQI